MLERIIIITYCCFLYKQIGAVGVIGRDRYGFFPLRGKLLNVREASVKQLSENKEIQNLKKILGLQEGKVYDNVKSLRYGHVMIMTDQVFRIPFKCTSV